MSTIRVYELAKKLGVSSKEVIDELLKNGVDVSNHMNVIDAETAEIIEQTFAEAASASSGSAGSGAEAAGGAAGEDSGGAAAEGEGGDDGGVVVELGKPISLQELAARLQRPPLQLQAELIQRGHMIALGHTLDPELIKLLAKRFEFTVVEPPPPETGRAKRKGKGKAKRKAKKAKRKGGAGGLQPRPPVITVMGHVDHGKTTLLDAIRHSKVAASEAGGITQHIGAYVVELDQGKLVFIDTPGHEAFTTMRARGSQVTDMVILVVAADDGVMPQTVEAINHARDAGVPIIVAINKIDKDNAAPDRIRQELVKLELVPEEWGGDTLFCEISAKQKTGIDELLELVFLQAELLELKGDVDAPVEGAVIESRLDRGMGPLATVLVQQGTLRVGMPFVSGSTYGKVRALIDDKGKRIKKAGPATPVEVLGFAEVPNAGDRFQVVESEKEARRISEERKIASRQKTLARGGKITFEDLFSRIQQGTVKELKIVIKADVQGSAEAVANALEKQSTPKVKVEIIHTGVGNISESDIMLASAAGAIVIGFGVKMDRHCEATAQRENVQVRLYSIIYDVIDDVRKAMLGLLEPEEVERELGRAEIRQVFRLSRGGTIAGSYILEGKVVRNARCRVLRDDEQIGEGQIVSLKRFKDDVREVQAGYECGIMIDGVDNFQEGDIISVFTVEKVAATLD
jgi:translation initiation factor IF-2